MNPQIFTNGRVNIIDNQHTQPYPLHEHKDNKVNDYHEALTGNQYNTVLSRAYFSKENIVIIHNGIRAGVYNKSGGNYVIGQQDENNIKIIMRGVFLDYVRHLPNVTEEILFLNNIVVDQCVHNIYNEAKAYMRYKQDVSTLAIPLDKPVSDHLKGSKQLELKPWF